MTGAAIEEVNASVAQVVRSRNFGTQGLDINEPLAMLRSAATSYYEADGLGSVTSLTDSTGAIAASYTYDSFGKLTASTGSLTNPFQFTGRELDTETGLYYYRARYYELGNGRFLSEDPIRFDASINFYAYVDNNPPNWTDPEGFDRVQVCCRGLTRFWGLLRIFNHCYLKILDDRGNFRASYGVLGDKNSTANQKPTTGDTGGPGSTDRNSGGKCKDVPGGDCQIKKLESGLESAVNSGTCPVCGSNYRGWIPTDLFHFFDGFNSNTWVYNLVAGAGLTPPPEPRSPGYHLAPGDWYPK